MGFTARFLFFEVVAVVLVLTADCFVFAGFRASTALAALEATCWTMSLVLFETSRSALRARCTLVRGRLLTVLDAVVFLVGRPVSFARACAWARVMSPVVSKPWAASSCRSSVGSAASVVSRRRRFAPAASFSCSEAER